MKTIEKKLFKIKVVRQKDVLVLAETQMMAMEIADMNLKSDDFSQSANEFRQIRQVKLSEEDIKNSRLPLYKTIGDGDKETLLLDKLKRMGFRKENVKLKYISKPDRQGWLIDISSPFDIRQIQALMECFGKESGKVIFKDMETGQFKFRISVSENDINYK